MKITLALSKAPVCVDQLARMAGGTLVLRGCTCPPTVSHMCTDSREANGDTLFCAIRGERVDGHAYIPTAVGGGCRAFLCERLPDGWEDLTEASPLGMASMAAILVPDTVEALGSLAKARRMTDLANLATVAITGSVGKTTTKEAVTAVLSASPSLTAVRPVFKKDGNYNSTIGLPLSFLEIDPSTAAAVLEMGMSERGEIASMTTAVRPHIALITNIGSSHLEYLGSRENIARAKFEIAAGLGEGDCLLINGDEPLLAGLGQDFDGEKPVIPAGIRVLRVSLAGTAGADYTAFGITPRAGGTGFDLATPAGVWRDLFIPAVGNHMVWAGAFAAATGQLMGLTEAEVRTGLASYRTAALRQSIRRVGGLTVIEDCYNAAPESMHAALEVLDTVARAAEGMAVTPPIPRRRIAVLGDMRELGADSVALHRAVGAETARRGVDMLVTVGSLGRDIAAGALDAGLSSDRVLITVETGDVDAYPAVAETLRRILRPGDCVLFKASRAMKLEQLCALVTSPESL